jgi:hypothetical protein
MKRFQGWSSADGRLATLPIVAIPLLYLAATLLYSACLAPWGRQVDPESAYAMNGLVAAAGYGSMKFDHPGTTTTLLVEVIIKLWALVVHAPDIVAFGLKNYHAIIYAARTGEAIFLFGALLAGGLIVLNTTGSMVAAMLFQIGPLVHPDTFHFEMVVIPESLMVSCAILGMALVVKAALDSHPPAVGLGIASGLAFALGFSSKFLYLPLALLGVSLLRNPRAFVAALATGIIGFIGFNLTFNPGTMTRGFGWLFSIATHKGIYGHGEPGFIDLDVFLSNFGTLVAEAPLVFAVYVVAAVTSLALMIRTRSCLDPISLTSLAAFIAFVLQVIATSKHFALHYMMASWVLTGGVLVLAGLETRRLFPVVPTTAIAGLAIAVSVFLVVGTLREARRQAIEWIHLDDIGARLSRAVETAGPACANVAGPFLRAPEDDESHGYDMTMSAWGDQAMKDRFSSSYVLAFGSTPLLDYNPTYRVLSRNFRPYSFARLAAEYPCIVVRANVELDRDNSLGLLDMNPDHCVIEDIQIYTVGLSCAKIQRAFSSTNDGS